ncbi:hypothetical protein M758_UG184100 [Ceratodon purpureus]|nr:hypothetical protein M758_UG184100 [Ceratodon purpureus]
MYLSHIRHTMFSSGGIPLAGQNIVSTTFYNNNTRDGKKFATLSESSRQSMTLNWRNTKLVQKSYHMLTPAPTNSYQCATTKSDLPVIPHKRNQMTSVSDG